MGNDIPKMLKDKSGVIVEKGEVKSFYTHVHSYYEIILYSPFDGALYVGGNEYNVNEYTAVVICPLDVHRILVKNSNNAIYIKVCVDDVNCFNDGNSSYALQNIKASDFIVSLFNQIAVENNENYKNMLANLIFYHIKTYGEMLSVSAKGKKVAQDALKYINENCVNQITLSKCANYLSITSEYLSKVFASSVGITFSKYLTELRINKACELLLNTSKNVTEVCYDCGFSNLSHFLRTFTKLKGKSPLRYKNSKLLKK